MTYRVYRGIAPEFLPSTTGGSPSSPQSTFTRASVAYNQAGTQVANGTPRYEPAKFGQGIMIEEGTTNLFLYNQQLDTAVWNKTVMPCFVTADAVVAPDGTTTMDKIVATGGNNKHGILQTLATCGADGQVISISGYLKKGTSKYGYLVERGDSPWHYGVFDLDAGTYIAAKSTGVSSAEIKHITNGIYLCSITYTRVASSNNTPGVGVAMGKWIFTFWLNNWRYRTRSKI